VERGNRLLVARMVGVQMVDPPARRWVGARGSLVDAHAMIVAPPE
jgi:hypothetical protein